MTDPQPAPAAPEQAPPFRMFERMEDLGVLDGALLPAVLAATSYSNECWAFDVAAGLADPIGWVQEEAYKRDRLRLARALFVARHCVPLDADMLGMIPSFHGASLTRGVWRVGHLASALVCTSARKDGTRELHLSIRGTDLEAHPSRLVSTLLVVGGYFLWTYPRIEKHARLFLPLCAALTRYAAMPENRIARIVVSGHSLGAATAQSLVPHLRVPHVALDLYGYGSPGTGSGWLRPVDLVAGTLASGALAAADAVRAVLRRALGKSAATPAPTGMYPEARLYQFMHPGDPVSKFGTYVYRREGRTYCTLSPADDMRRREGHAPAGLGMEAHSKSRYADAIEALLERAWLDLARGQALPERLAAMTAAREEAFALELAVPPHLLDERIAAARQQYADRLRALDPDDPALSREGARQAAPQDPERIRIYRLARKFQTGQMVLTRTGRIPEELRSTGRLGGQPRGAAPARPVETAGTDDPPSS